MPDDNKPQGEPGNPPPAAGAAADGTRPKLAPLPEISDEVKARNRPSGRHYVEPSPLGIEPVVQTGVDKATNPPRSSERPAPSPEVPLGSGEQYEPPGLGGMGSH